MMHARCLPLRFRFVAALAVSALLGLSCGGETPAGQIDMRTPPPSPTPTLPPTNWSSVCSLGPGNPNADCDQTSPRLLEQVEAAMNRLVASRPDIFDLSNEYSPGTGAYKVVNQSAYMNGLVAELQRAGLCAEVDVFAPNGSMDVIFVKDSNDSSEEFDVLLGSGHMRRGSGSYVSTCTPAFFPYELTADTPPVDSGCYRPFPPEVHHMYCKIHTISEGHYVLDATPYVSDWNYCQETGFIGKSDCPVRPNGAVDQRACEDWRTGIAKDTGRPGPTWTKVDDLGNELGYCTGPASDCQNTPDNQYALWTYAPGTYKCVAQTGKPDWVVVPN